MKTALAGQKVSAAAYCELRGRSRDNPLLAAAAKATEEEILEFLETISDFDGHQAKHIWSTAERNSIQWG